MVEGCLTSGSNYDTELRMMTYGLEFNEIEGEDVLARLKSAGVSIFRCAVSGVKRVSELVGSHVRIR